MSFLGRIFFGFLFLVSIGLGAPLGLFLILQIFVLSTLIYVFHWVGGSPRPVSYTPKFVLLT